MSLQFTMTLCSPSSAAGERGRAEWVGRLPGAGASSTQIPLLGMTICHGSPHTPAVPRRSLALNINTRQMSSFARLSLERCSCEAQWLFGSDGNFGT